MIASTEANVSVTKEEQGRLDWIGNLSVFFRNIIKEIFKEKEYCR